MHARTGQSQRETSGKSSTWFPLGGHVQKELCWSRLLLFCSHSCRSGFSIFAILQSMRAHCTYNDWICRCFWNSNFRWEMVQPTLLFDTNSSFKEREAFHQGLHFFPLTWVLEFCVLAVRSPNFHRIIFDTFRGIRIDTSGSPGFEWMASSTLLRVTSAKKTPRELTKKAFGIQCNRKFLTLDGFG